MIVNFEISELEPVSRADHDRAIRLFDRSALDQLLQNCHRHARVRAAIHTCQIRLSRGLGQLGFRCLFDDTVSFLNRFDRFVVADRITDANRIGQCLACSDRNFFLESVFERLIKRISLLRLSGNQSRHLVDYTEIHQQLKPLMQGADVAKISNGDNDPIRNSPVKLSDNFNADRFLTFDTKAVHGICQIDTAVLGDFFDDVHAAIKICVQRQYVGSIGNRLD